MERFFSVFGKIIIGTVALILILGAGYYIGTHKNDLGLSPTPFPTAAQPTTSVIPTETLTTVPNTTSTPSKIISSGLATPYTISVPDGWVQSHEQQDDIQLDKLTLSKSGYILSIYQAPMGGGVCLYANGQQFQGPSQTFLYFAPISGTSFDLRRSWNIDGQNTTQIYTVCQKGQDLYSTITTFGSISYETPKNPDGKMLSEMDAIVASLEKQ